jgi:hypothetical protein
MTFLGMGIASGADIRHFFNVLRSWDSFFHVAKRVTRHLWDLAIYGRAMQLVNGNALVAGLAKSAFDAGVDIRVNSPALRLVTEDGADGVQKIRGAVVMHNGAEQTLRARRGVMLATGGFPHGATTFFSCLAW